MAVFKPPKEAKQMKKGDKLDLTPDKCPDKCEGIMKELVDYGDGEEYPCCGDEVLIHYTAYIYEFEEEYIFDSSRMQALPGKEPQPFKFKMEHGEVVRGLEIAISTMKKGEKAIIHLKPEYGYGRVGAPPKVPANANVIFETELVDFFGEDLSELEDKSIIKHVLQKGKGHTTVNEGGLVEVHLTGKHDGEVFEERDVTFIMGEGKIHGLTQQLEECIKELKQSEIARFNFAPKYFFNGKGCEEKGIPPEAELSYIIHMKKFEKEKDIWEMNNEQKLDQCGIFKQKGTDFFKKKEYEMALKYYCQILSYLENDRCMTEDEEKRRRQELVLAGHLNCAQCYLNLDECHKARQQCEKAIKIDPSSVKGYFRRGQAYFNTKDFQEAKADFEKVVQLEPGNKIAVKRIGDCEKQIKAMSSQQHDLYRRMMAGVGQGQTQTEQYLSYNQGDVFDQLGEWNNSMARGMMTLEQECEAFGEAIPVRGNNNNGHPNANLNS